MSLILSGTDGLSDVDGTAATPAIRGTDANTGIFFPAADTIAFAEGGAEIARFNSSGNLGIGTSSPVTLKSATTLQVLGNIKAGSVDGAGLVSLGDTSSTGANAGIWRGAAGAYGSTGNYLNLGGYDGITFTAGNADIASQTERMRIDSSGNVGIGTTSPSTYGQLAVYTASSNVEIAAVTDGANYATYRLQNNSRRYSMQIRTDQSNAWVLRDENAGVNRMMCITSGQVGINATPAAGNTFRVINIGSDNAVQFGNASNGVYLPSGGTSFSAYSDVRLKNITGRYETPLADIAKLDAIKFTWKNDTENKPCVGVSAQSVETVIPEAIDRGTNFNAEGDTTEYLSVKYTELIPLMIASIQELKAINDTQASTITALTARITALETP